jgi:hypothetical protein
VYKADHLSATRDNRKLGTALKAAIQVVELADESLRMYAARSVPYLGHLNPSNLWLESYITFGNSEIGGILFTCT